MSPPLTDEQRARAAAEAAQQVAATLRSRRAPAADIRFDS